MKTTKILFALSACAVLTLLNSCTVNVDPNKTVDGTATTTTQAYDPYTGTSTTTKKTVNY